MTVPVLLLLSDDFLDHFMQTFIRILVTVNADELLARALVGASTFDLVFDVRLHFVHFLVVRLLFSALALFGTSVARFA